MAMNSSEHVLPDGPVGSERERREAGLRDWRSGCGLGRFEISPSLVRPRSREAGWGKVAAWFGRLLRLAFLAMSCARVSPAIGAQPFVKTIQAVTSVSSVQVQVMESDDDGAVFVAGVFSGKIQFTSTLELETSKGIPAVFLARQDPNGGWTWAKSIWVGATGDEFNVKDLSISATQILLGGDLKPSAVPMRGFLALQSKTNITSAPVTKLFTGGTDAAAYVGVSRVGLGADGAMYAGGRYYRAATDGTVTIPGIPPKAGTVLDQDVFVARLNPLLGFQWYARAGSSLQTLDASFPARANGALEDLAGLEVDAAGNVLVVMNLAGLKYSLLGLVLQNYPVYLFDAGGVSNFSTYTGVYQTGSDKNWNGALTAVAGRLTSAGVWSRPGALEVSLTLDHPVQMLDKTWNVPATDMALANGKMYVVGQYRNNTQTNGFLLRAAVDTLNGDGPAVYLKSGTTDPTSPRRVAAGGDIITVAGGMGRTLQAYLTSATESELGLVDHEITSIQTNQFLAGFSADLTPRWARATTRPNDELKPAVFTGSALTYDRLHRLVYWGGTFQDGLRKLFLGSEENPILLGPVARSTGWLAALGDDGEYLEQVRLTVLSDFGPIVLNGASFAQTRVDNIYLRDTQITAEVPAQYPATLTESDGTRQRCTGFRLDGTVVSGDSPRYTFSLIEDTTLTFNWQTQYKLEIKSDHADAGLSGTAAAGAADPPIGVSWIGKDELVTAFVDGLVLPLDAAQSGTRYVVTGYDATGAAGANRAFPLVAARQQVPQFAMSGPASLRYRWKKQNRLQISTTSDGTYSLPLARQLSAAGAEVARGAGSGEFWFDDGTVVQILGLAQDTSSGKALKGWRNADPNDGAFPLIEFVALDDAQLDATELDVHLDSFSVDGKAYWGRSLPALRHAVRVTWDYGDLVYRVEATIGDALVLPRGVSILTGRPPLNVRVVDAPPGSTGNDMQIWDDVADRALPLRPGIYFADWDNGSGGRIVTQVFAGFPGEPIPGTKPARYYPGTSHYRHIANTPPEASPPVSLDPSADDALFFRELKYQSGSALVAEGRFSASAPGKAVLLFSRSLVPGRPAVGDLTREELRVRVVETRFWNHATDWAGGATMVKGPFDATIGTKLASAFDTARLGTGYLVHEIANYNPELHDRTRVVGPIIPVNRHPNPALVAEDQRLVVVWYERVDGILWPYQPASYENFDWPEPPSGPNPDPAALKRIVIASRLGSEGLDAAGNRQPIFDPEQYEAVKIYAQPDPLRPGYNPNEEHARIYPSLLPGDSGTVVPAAFALRDDLNISEALIATLSSRFQMSQYTSDPYVLVQFVDRKSGQPGMAVYAVQREDAATHDPKVSELPGSATDAYVFRYALKAGEPVSAPYPLNLVIGLHPCVNTVPDLFSTTNALPNGSYFENGNVAQRTWFVDHQGQPWAVSGNSFLFARYTYRLAADFWYPGDLDASSGSPVEGDCLTFLPLLRLADGLAGVFDPVAVTRSTPVPVRYDTVWPDSTPILKIGETLTYAGGEQQADDPEAPGLPGVIGWAAGEVVFDSMNPSMAPVTSLGAARDFSARLIAPLPARRVALSTARLPESLKAGSPDVRVEGDTWYFSKLSPSLQKRVFFRPLERLQPSDPPGVLALRGYVNDRTLGASDLTASPPPLYVLEPNVLTGSEREELLRLASGGASWSTAVRRLYALTRNPSSVDLSTGREADAWLVGLRPEQAYDANGKNPSSRETRAVPFAGLGPGLAVVTNPRLLNPEVPFTSGYVTLVENNDPSLGAAPVALHILKIDRNLRYRGAIKTILPPNVFDEKISLRHTADFGGNTDEAAFAWWYREEDGKAKPGDVPPGSAPAPIWSAFASALGVAGQNQIELQGNPALLLADNQFFVRYRAASNLPPATVVWSEWAGAANSSIQDLDGDGRPDLRAQLAGGWVKRVLDAVNPYEARVREFTRSSSPSTAASMIQQLGAPFVGPVALNASKDVVENVGLIELYETVLARARALSIDASQPTATPGVNAAILLATTRLADFYTVLGNEAWQDAQDPTLGLGGSGVEASALTANRFCFENQLPSLLEEELALLRGTDESLGRPVYNRLFWNFTKGEGEVAYASNYQIKDVNNDGFIDESDALRHFPQGHGDAWGHYLTAMRRRYDLLRHPRFDWEARAEYYNLLDVVIGVDFSDERKFAQTAASRAQAGSEIVASTYRQRYVENPDGQWQGYLDSDTNRVWGVTEWARRTGQAALFDWVVANALLVPEDLDPTHTGIRRIDRRSVGEVATISANLGAIQTTLDASNTGLTPLGLDPDVVPFDIDPTHLDVGSTAQIGRQAVQGLTHFEQIFERAFGALKNASEVLAYANEEKSRLRSVSEAADQNRLDAVAQDLEFRNRLIEIFGTPYQGTIGPGLPYPAGYNGPDLNLFMYVDVNAIEAGTVPQPAADYFDEFVSFHDLLSDVPEEFAEVAASYFMKDGEDADIDFSSNTAVSLLGEGILHLRLPATAGDYTFVAPERWGQRAAPGRLQTLVTEMLRAEADLSLAVGDYDFLYKQIRDRVEVMKARSDAEVASLQIMDAQYQTLIGLNTAIDALRTTSAGLLFTGDLAMNISDATAEGVPKVVGVAADPSFPVRLATKVYGAGAQFFLRVGAISAEQAADILESSKEIIALRDDLKSQRKDFEPELAAMLAEIEELLVNEGVIRIKVFSLREQLRGVLDQYRATLQEGVRLLEERQNYNVRVAAATQENRYQDMTFRLARQESLQRYRATFDLAARYAYLAAKAYDYETNFDPNDRASAVPLLNQIVRERSLGVLGDNQPLNRGGLAGLLARLYDNFRAVEGRLGFNNLQLDTTEFSLRSELFRVRTDTDWAARLASARVADLWALPEFRRFCRPFAPRGGAQPGLVFRFGSEVTAGRNFFGQPLGPGDSAYDPSVYATKIRAAGLRLPGYPVDQLARTPYVYLVPAGLDRLLIPDSPSLQVRTWNVVDQAIPVPFATGPADLARADWIPMVDSLNGAFGAIRRFSSFRAGVTADDPVLNVTRFVGRSVANSDWLLIIPGQGLHANPDTGLNQLIANLADIRLTFETYGYSGN